MKICTVRGCEKEEKAKGYCDKHYQVWFRNGVPETEKTRNRGKGFVNSYGYKILCINGKAGIREHRYFMEQYLGRELTRTEVIHHINGVKTDNRIENLKICSNSEHGTEHARIYIEEKKCTNCGETKKLSEFHYRLNRPTYKKRRRFYDSWCKKCVVDRKREWRRKKRLLGLRYT